jgi:hypothetical protein
MPWTVRDSWVAIDSLPGVRFDTDPIKLVVQYAQLHEIENMRAIALAP